MKKLHPLVRLSFFALLITLFTLNSCSSSKDKIIKVDPAFAAYVSGYTSGMVSKSSPIRIELTNALSKDLSTQPDSTLLEDIIEFEPEIEGKIQWVNNRTIEFVPNENLPSNQLYTATFELDKVAKVKDGYEDFVFQFATYAQKIEITEPEIEYYDYYDRTSLHLNLQMTTSDLEDTSNIRKIVTATYKNKNLPIRVEEYYEDNTYSIFIDSIVRTENEEEVTINWDGSPINSISRGSKRITIPALNDYSVTSCQVQDNGDQSIDIVFSEPLHPLQYLDGIIQLEGVENLTFSISDNKITAFLPNRIIGNRTLKINTGILNYGGRKIKKGYSTELEFEEAKPMLRIKGNGSILPNSSGLIFPFEAIGIKAVDVRIIKILEPNIHHFLQVNNLNGDDNLTRFGKVIAEKTVKLDYDKKINLKAWNSHVIDLNKLISPDPGAIYRVCIKTKKEYALCDCPIKETNNEVKYEEEEEETDPDWSEANWEGYGFGGGYDTWYYYSSNGNPCDDDYYDGLAVGRNILASNLGVICKIDAEKKAHAIISDMVTTKPLKNVEVTYYDYIKQTLAKGTTDENGMFDVTLSQKPFLLIAKYGKQRGYLKLLDEHSNSLSKFDIEGDKAQRGLKGFIYSERGVWRPGDSLYINFILEDKLNKFPDKHPIHFALFDPAGEKIHEYTTSSHLGRIYSYKTKTENDALTGNYCVKIKVGNRLFTKNLKIESIQPNRLKIYMDLDEGSVVKSSSNDSVSMQVKWLHGALAKNLRASIGVKINSTKTTFTGYKGYVFDSPMRKLKVNDQQIYDGTLNQYGKTRFSTMLKHCEEAPGRVSVAFITKVFEQGGNFSTDRKVCQYSPFSRYVGLSIPSSDQYDNTLETGKKHQFDVVSLDENGKTTNAQNLIVKIYKLEWKWWYERTDENYANFNGASSTFLVKDTTIDALNGKGHFNFGIKYPDYGRFLITVTDPKSNHQTGKIVSLDWPYWSRGNRNENKNASMLNFACDKERYNVGEDIKISFPSPAVGRALISIESRTKVIKKYWINTVKGETMHTLKADATMSPNVFIHITLIQPHANTKNDLPIRMYGVVPIMVDNPATHLTPILNVPKEIKPESTVNLQVREEKGKKMYYTIAVVDEGLLDLTNFKTPQPWNVFYAKEALGVKTWDVYDDVIGAYAGKLDKLLSIGGDGDNLAGKAVKANRFKPVVRHLGPFVLEAGQVKNHKIHIPAYVGAVRFMIVAHNEGAYGASEKLVEVKKPLMILPSLPRTIGPNEEISLPIDVFAMDPKIKNVQVSIETNGLFSIEGSKTQSLTFNDEGDEILNFKLKTKNETGIGKIKIIATSGNEISTDEIEIDVKLPNDLKTQTKEIELKPGEKWAGKIDFFGIRGTNSCVVEASNIPPISLENRLNYLIQYPHGCIEQTTSSAFPQLYLNDLMQLSDKRQEKISYNITKAIKRIRSFQTADGGFSYWPGESEENDWGTNYAGHFLIEAEKRGYAVSADIKRRWVEFQKNKAEHWENYGDNNSQQLIQAYRLYVLALSGNAQTGAMNRLKEESSLSPAAIWRLAAAYSLIGQSDIARKMVLKLSTSVEKYRELSASYGTDIRDKAMILETTNLLGMDAKSTGLVKEISHKLSSKSFMSTQETAYSLLAISKYISQNGVQKGIEYSLKYANNSKQIQSKSILDENTIYESELADNGTVAIQNTGKNKLFIRLYTKGVPTQSIRKKIENKIEIDIKYFNSDGDVILPNKIKQGTDFKCVITVKNPTSKYYKELAITQIVASGWEILNPRMDMDEYQSNARYQNFRDDRVYSYIDLGPNDSKQIVIPLNASYLGKYYLPSIGVEAMYDESISGETASEWVEVIK